MARLRTVKNEITILAETLGHALFLWRKHPEIKPTEREDAPPSFETICAFCGERFEVEGIRAPYVSGPANHRCTGKAA
jgi:hypothetical protein